MECNDDEQSEPVKIEDGSFAMIISENDAINIDNCERAVLRTAHPTIRAAISKHLSEISKKKAFEKAGSSGIKANSYLYNVDGEVGRFKFETHSVVADGQNLYNSAQDLFTMLKGKEFYKTSGFKDIAYIYGDTDKSYRKTALLINRVRYQMDGGTPYRTLQFNTENEGTSLNRYLNTMTEQILKQNEFDQNGKYHGDVTYDAMTPAKTLSA